MECALCGLPAQGCCPAGAAPFCQRHRPAFCFRCAALVDPPPAETPSPTAIRAGPPPPVPPKHPPSLRWLSIYVEEDAGPPACAVCGRLTRRRCRHCQTLFCAAHAAGPDLCLTCARSARLGLWVLLTLAAALTWLALR
jgi:hypothetical protein